MKMAKTLIVGALMAGFLAVPAHAQKKQEDSARAIEDAEKKKAAASVDQQYRAALERTRQETSAAPQDPWANMRGSEPPKTKR